MLTENGAIGASCTHHEAQHTGGNVCNDAGEWHPEVSQHTPQVYDRVRPCADMRG